MDGIEALEEQLLFFKQKKLMKAYERGQWNILTKIVMQLRDMKRMYPEQKKALRKMARERYHEFNRETGLSLWYNLYIFRMIYPELIPYIWLKSTYRKYITIFKEILSQK